MSEHQELAEKAAKFELGQCVITPGAIVALTFNHVSPQLLLYRHSHGDYGDLSEEDKRLNDEAIETGDRILSAYSLADGEKVWIISEGDRSASTILLPSEY